MAYICSLNIQETDFKSIPCCPVICTTPCLASPRLQMEVWHYVWAGDVCDSDVTAGNLNSGDHAWWELPLGHLLLNNKSQKLELSKVFHRIKCVNKIIFTARARITILNWELTSVSSWSYPFRMFFWWEEESHLKVNVSLFSLWGKRRQNKITALSCNIGCGLQVYCVFSPNTLGKELFYFS